ncbi:MAG TPA: histidine phosphatase family protein [Hyphomicrobiaceae bacterium]|jgi:broad specificity phosphatase PhoE|nr:histidine phosphatase family protein [Hyphomicrobiaceae bacterium]
MPAATRWWWIRHAPVPDGGRIYGQRDLACDCSDREAFAGLAAEVPAEAVWVTSHLVRTTQTARAIHAADPGKFAGVELLALPELAEQHLGDWQGLDRQAFYAARGIGTHMLWLAEADERAPGGESFADLMRRVAPAIDRLNAAHRGRDIVAVTHGGTIRAALGLALGIPPRAALAFSTENCSLTRLDHLPGAGGAGVWRVVAVNRRLARAAPAGSAAI